MTLNGRQPEMENTPSPKMGGGRNLSKMKKSKWFEIARYGEKSGQNKIPPPKQRFSEYKYW